MKRRKIVRILVAALVAGGILAVGTGWLIFAVNSPLNRSSAVSTTYEWARLRPIPDTAVDVSVQALGSMFTREFRISFTAPSADVASWLASSPGTKEAVPERQQDGTMVYGIKPGGGAQFAEVTVSEDESRVVIRAYWS
jgi:hypothetical protein